MASAGLRWTLLTTCLISVAYAQGLQVVNGQIFGNGLAVYNSPQPDTPMGGDTLHVSIEVTSNGRLEQPPYPDNVRNGIIGMNMFLTSTVTGRNFTISNGTFQGSSRDAIDTPEFLCNSTTNEGFENAGCKEIMLQEPGSTVKHVNWVWPDCLVGNGGGGDDRGPYNISFHENLRINGSDFYTITDLPIRVTNTIPLDTQLAGSQQRPRCDLRNNPLYPFEERDAAINSPVTGATSSGLPMDVDSGSNGVGSGSSGSNSQNPGGAGDEILDPGSPNSGSLGPDRLGVEGRSSKTASVSDFILLGAISLTALVSVR